jgi:hypothetical protein
MPSLQDAHKLARAKARRAANNNYNKLLKTLHKKLAKLEQKYGTRVYLIAQRNGRTNEFASADATGQPWSPPDRKALVSTLHLSLETINTRQGSTISASDNETVAGR